MRVLNVIKNRLKLVFAPNINAAGKQGGFTLIELTVSIAIITIMVGLFLVDYHSTNSKRQLSTTAQTMVSDIRLAQNFSLGYKEHNSVFPYGWGLYFDISTDPDRYVIFADDDGDGLRDADGNEDFKVVNMLEGLDIDSIKVFDSSWGTYTGANKQVVFISPDPEVYITDNSDYTKMRIILLDNRTGDEKKLEINFFGLVEIID